MSMLPTISEIEKRLKDTQLLEVGCSLMSDAVIITNENADILYVNRAFELNTGFSASEAIGKNLKDLLNEKMSKKSYDEMWHTIKVEKKPFAGEMLHVRKDKTIYRQDFHIAPVLDKRGEVKFFIVIGPSVTERKRRIQLREEFVSAVGHQLRNPLISIKWLLKTLLKDVDVNEERKKLEAIYQENKSLSDLVSDLLILARMEKGQLNSENILLNEELESLIESVKQRHPTVYFEFKNEAGALPLATIKSLARQVFLNLMYNAAEHTNKEHGKVIIKIERPQPLIRFSVYNNGSPIPEEIRPRVFSKVPSKTGEGLGLFLVKMIADYLGWQVSFQTRKSGTTFFVEIPSPLLKK